MANQVTQGTKRELLKNELTIFTLDIIYKTTVTIKQEQAVTKRL